VNIFIFYVGMTRKLYPWRCQLGMDILELDHKLLLQSIWDKRVRFRNWCILGGTWESEWIGVNLLLGIRYGSRRLRRLTQRQNSLSHIRIWVMNVHQSQRFLIVRLK
jgi:hypothetical protein